MPRPSRERLLDSAVDLLQRQGYHGTGLNELLERSEAPRGSLYHYFPGGKEQIGAEAIARAGDQVAAAVVHLLRAKPSVADAVEALAGLLAAGLETSDFERGCPVATTALEVTPGSEPIRAAVQASFESWLAPLRERLEAAGFDRLQAARRADLAIATLEGALVLARARQDADVLREAARQLRALLEAPEAAF
jgi:TetR/AcrR family transcriptional repressor of lmrAB and yxaGH operons